MKSAPSPRAGVPLGILAHRIELIQRPGDRLLYAAPEQWTLKGRPTTYFGTTLPQIERIPASRSATNSTQRRHAAHSDHDDEETSMFRALLIDGQTTDTETHDDILNPFDGSIVGTVAMAGAEEMDDAIAAAARVHSRSDGRAPAQPKRGARDAHGSGERQANPLWAKRGRAGVHDLQTRRGRSTTLRR